MPSNNIIFIELVLYLLWMLIIGIYFSKKKFTQADYHIGGKKIVGWALALSERATGESAWLILGLTGFAFFKGFSAIWIAIGCILGIVFSWIFLAKKFREEAEKYNVITSLPNIFSLTGSLYGFTAGIMIFNNFSWFFGYLGGQPQLSTRWMAMKNNSDVKKGMVIALLWLLLFTSNNSFFFLEEI